MNFIGGNNYLSDPDSDAELASMTGGDDSSFYPDSEAGSESVYSGGMELSDYELDSQCGGDTDAAILQMGGYQSDENVVVPTVAEQKGGATNTPTTHEAEAAVAVSASTMETISYNHERDSDSERETKSDGERESKSDGVHRSKSDGVHGSEEVNAAHRNAASKEEEKNVDTNFKRILNTKNFNTLLGTLVSYKTLQNPKLNDLVDLCITEKKQIEGNPTPTIPENEIKEFVTEKINDLVSNSINQDGIKPAEGTETQIEKNDQLIETIVKCKILSHLLMSGFHIPPDMTITANFEKDKDNNYKFLIPLKRGTK